MLPRLGTSKFVTRWIVVTLVASIVAALDGGWLAGWAALAPSRVWHGEVWRLATWPLPEPGPVSPGGTCLATYKFGGGLAGAWGDHRPRRVGRPLGARGAAGTGRLAAAPGGAAPGR